MAVKRAASAYRVQAERQEIKIELGVPSNLPEIEVDAERMAQVLGNLLSNALRHTPPGGKIILAADQDEAQILLTVADTGEGISPADLPLIFERSFRGDPARQQNGGETGLGLAIARSLVEAQGGSIRVESQLGLGTKFTISIPKQAAQPAHPA